MKYNFQFAKNWKAFEAWYKKQGEIPWSIQTKMIRGFFEKSVPNLIDWNRLWADYRVWTNSLEAEKGRRRILWQEEKRQVETLLLEQMKDLDKEIHVLAYNYKGLPEVNSDKMTYWDALDLKKKLEGNGNGEGGNEFIDKINIINLKNLIK